jgi:hypothetical protein
MILLQQNAKDAERAKEYAASSTSSMTTATGTSQGQKPAASSQTSNSTGTKRDAPKK